MDINEDDIVTIIANNDIEKNINSQAIGIFKCFGTNNTSCTLKIGMANIDKDNFYFINNQKGWKVDEIRKSNKEEIKLFFDRLSKEI